MKACGIRKEKGLPAWNILLCLISMIFTDKSIPALERDGNLPCGKSSLFRFLDNPGFGWRKVVLLFALKILFLFMKPAAGEGKKLFEVLIVDDTLYSRNRSKKVELLSRKYDHNTGRYVKGFDLLTVGTTVAGNPEYGPSNERPGSGTYLRQALGHQGFLQGM